MSKVKRIARPATQRWREPVSWNRSRQERRKIQKEQYEQGDQKKRRPRARNSTLNRQRRRHYTKGKGQQGIGIPPSRMARAMRRFIARGDYELRLVVGPQFHQGKWYAWSDGIDCLRAQLDAYASMLCDVAFEGASCRDRAYATEADTKTRKRPKGLKCRVVDLKRAIRIVRRVSY